MHGRLKVKTTAQQEAERKAERAEKVKAYQAAMSAILERRESGRLDEKLLQMIGPVLMGNPDINTLWNVRRETVLKAIEEEGTGDDKPFKRDELLKSEVFLTQHCLMTNPKSYGAWHHRCWCLLKMLEPNWKAEVALCDKYLDMDERNFHCWDYRRFVVHHAGRAPQEELDFSTEKIEKNFSNYSAWHYRSRLLPLTHPPREGEISRIGISEQKRREELDLVQNAAFTDPEDSSAWFYHTWLLGSGRGEQSRRAGSLLTLLRRQRDLYVVLSKPLPASRLDCAVDGVKMDPSRATTPVPEGGAAATSRVWKLDARDLPRGVQVVVSDVRTGGTLALTVGGGEADVALADDFELKSNESTDEATTKVLRQDLQNCRELLELEPDSKWTRLSMVLIMQALDEKDFLEDTISNLEKLQEVDFVRRNYYSDWRSRCVMLNRTRSVGMDCTLDLTGLGLTHLPCPERLALPKKIGLAGNKLSDVGTFLPYLLNCEELDLRNNPVSLAKLVQCLERASVPPCTVKTVRLSSKLLKGGEETELADRLQKIAPTTKFIFSE